MDYKKYLAVLAIAAMSIAVKVDMQGSLSLGKEVVDTISYYLRHNYIDGRRSMSLKPVKDDFSTTVYSAHLCRNLGICQKQLRKFINEYVIMLGTTIDGIIFNPVSNLNDTKTQSAFKEQLKHCVRYVRKILKSANEDISETNEVFTWTDVIKRVSGKFQHEALTFISDRLKGNAKDMGDAKKKVTQKLVEITVIIEAEYQTKLCSEHKICIKSYECTKALNSLLERFKNMSDEKVKEFMKSFYEVLPDTTLYSKLEEVTANEFQVILNDMAYSNKVPTKNLLTAVQKTVELRLESIENGVHVTNGRDIELVHMILSDMDHFYSRHKHEAFYDFNSKFDEWTKEGGRLNTMVQQVVKDISQQLSGKPDVLIIKLINEVRVFLEITVDPEK